MRTRRPNTSMRTAGRASEADDRLRDLCAAGADQPGEPDDLALVHRERDVLELRPACDKCLHLERRPCRSVRACALVGGKVAPDHPVDEPVLIDLARLGSAPVRLPSRSTVTRSAIWKISSR